MIVAIVIGLIISTTVVAIVLYRWTSKKELEAELHRDEDEADVERFETLRD